MYPLQTPHPAEQVLGRHCAPCLIEAGGNEGHSTHWSARGMDIYRWCSAWRGAQCLLEGSVASMPSALHRTYGIGSGGPAVGRV